MTRSATSAQATPPQRRELLDIKPSSALIHVELAQFYSADNAAGPIDDDIDDESGLLVSHAGARLERKSPFRVVHGVKDVTIAPTATGRCTSSTGSAAGRRRHSRSATVRACFASSPPDVVALLARQHGVATTPSSTRPGSPNVAALSRSSVVCCCVRIGACTSTVQCGERRLTSRATPCACWPCSSSRRTPSASAQRPQWSSSCRCGVRRIDPTWCAPARVGRLAGAVVRRTQMPPEDVVDVEGLFVTSIPVTCAAVAATSTLPDALITLDAALRRGYPDQRTAGRGRPTPLREPATAGGAGDPLGRPLVGVVAGVAVAGAGDRVGPARTAVQRHPHRRGSRGTCGRSLG